jgi:hypothetical protein
MHFKVQLFYYINEILEIFHVRYDDLVEAIKYGNKKSCHSFKVYDSDGCLHHDSKDHGQHDHYV